VSKLNNIECVSKILIVGGGIAGMAAAMRLSDQGVKIDLIEKDPEWGIYGTGLTLSILTMRALCDLGLAEDLKREGAGFDILDMFDPTGNKITSIPNPRLYSPEMPGAGGIMRPALHRIMSERVKASGTNIRLGLTVKSYTQDANGVNTTFSDGSTGRYDLLVAADGLYSEMREMTFPDAPKPEFTGQACWRVLFDIPADWDTARMYIGKDVKLGFNPLTSSTMYMYLLEHVPDNPRIKESDYIEKLMALTKNFDGAIGDLRKNINADSNIHYRPLEAILLPQWVKDRVVLIGDCAHATTPHLASGAGVAVEDAIVLADELSKNVDVIAALDAFEARRIPRGSFIVNNSLEIGKLEMSNAPMSEIGGLMTESFKGMAAPY